VYTYHRGVCAYQWPFFYGRSDSSSEELVYHSNDEYDNFDDAYGYVQDENGSDTDDEVEEANAIDDMIKTMEGN
jgi:hypothetical protein